MMITSTGQPVAPIILRGVMGVVSTWQILRKQSDGVMITSAYSMRDGVRTGQEQHT